MHQELRHELQQEVRQEVRQETQQETQRDRKDRSNTHRDRNDPMDHRMQRILQDRIKVGRQILVSIQIQVT